MSLTLNDLTALYPDQLLLTFSPQERDTIWNQIQTQSYSNNLAYQNAYVNQLCLAIFLNYLENDSEIKEHPSSAFSSLDLLSLLELVKGTAIELGNNRLILIPQSTEMTNEFRIPREWIEIPSWTGNYYLSIEINLDGCYLRVIGYTTYQQIIKEGKIDKMDETYCFEIDNLIEDISVMWLTPQYTKSQENKPHSLLNISSNKVSSLIEKLGQPTPYSPRLDIPFNQWMTLIENHQWRQELYQKRLGNNSLSVMSSVTETVINLGDWLQANFEAGWQSLDSFLSAESGNLAYSFRRQDQADTNGVKFIRLDKQTVALIVRLIIDNEQKTYIQVQLAPMDRHTYLPSKICLKLLSSSGKILQESVAHSQTNMIQLKRFTCSQGKSFNIQVALENSSVVNLFFCLYH